MAQIKVYGLGVHLGRLGARRAIRGSRSIPSVGCEEACVGTIHGSVALVTGGTRNVGKGIALGLGESGATVYVTGRSITERVARVIDAIGGRGVVIRCDHSDDDAVRAVFERIERGEGRLDVLVNNARGGYRRLRNRKANPGFSWKQPFWQQPIRLWDDMFDVGVRSSYVASVYAARIMIEQGSGLIVNVSFFAGQRYEGNVPYGVSKAAVDRLAHDMVVELKPHGVASVSIYPGHVVEKKANRNPKRESAQFVGRAVAALAADPGTCSIVPEACWWQPRWPESTSSSIPMARSRSRMMRSRQAIYEPRGAAGGGRG